MKSEASVWNNCIPPKPALLHTFPASTALNKMSGKEKRKKNSTGKHCSVFGLLSDITYHSVKDTEYFFYMFLFKPKIL